MISLILCLVTVQVCSIEISTTPPPSCASPNLARQYDFTRETRFDYSGNHDATHLSTVPLLLTDQGAVFPPEASAPPPNPPGLSLGVLGQGPPTDGDSSIAFHMTIVRREPIPRGAREYLFHGALSSADQSSPTYPHDPTMIAFGCRFVNESTDRPDVIDLDCFTHLEVVREGDEGCPVGTCSVHAVDSLTTLGSAPTPIIRADLALNTRYLISILSEWDSSKDMHFYSLYVNGVVAHTDGLLLDSAQQFIPVATNLTLGRVRDCGPGDDCGALRGTTIESFIVDVDPERDSFPVHWTACRDLMSDLPPGPRPSSSLDESTSSTVEPTQLGGSSKPTATDSLAAGVSATAASTSMQTGGVLDSGEESVEADKGDSAESEDGGLSLTVIVPVLVASIVAAGLVCAALVVKSRQRRHVLRTSTTFSSRGDQAVSSRSKSGPTFRRYSVRKKHDKSEYAVIGDVLSGTSSSVGYSSMPGQRTGDYLAMPASVYSPMPSLPPSTSSTYQSIDRRRKGDEYETTELGWSNP